MPRGRFISKEICLDKQVNDLSCAESMLAFTWLIPHLDKEGRTYGDPAVVRSMIFPRRTDISIEKMESYLQEWNDIGLIVWYEYENDKYILFPNFDKHQTGLNKTREADSVIPIPDKLLSNAGVDRDQDTVKFKLKLSKEEVKDKVEVEVSNSDIQNLENLSDTFKELTHIELKPEKFIPFMKIGVTKHDMRQAVRELAGKDLNIPTTPEGMWKPVINVLNKRKAKDDQAEPDYRRYLEGEYGEIGNY